MRRLIHSPPSRNRGSESCGSSPPTEPQTDTEGPFLLTEPFWLIRGWLSELSPSASTLPALPGPTNVTACWLQKKLRLVNDALRPGGYSPAPHTRPQPHLD